MQIDNHKNCVNIGAMGEERAEQFLLAAGYQLIEKNYKVFIGEIDLIVKNEEYIVFVEVKARKNDLFGIPSDYVTSSKIDKIVRTAEMYLTNHPTVLQPRFDVIEIYYEDERIRHIIDAF